MLFIDQPLGVGFSKPVEEDKVGHTSSVGLALIFSSLTRLKQRASTWSSSSTW